MFNDLIRMEEWSDEKLVERIDNIRMKIGKAAETGYGNNNVIVSMQEIEHQLMQEFMTRVELRRHEEIGEAMDAPLNIGGQDDTGLMRERAREEEREKRLRKLKAAENPDAGFIEGLDEPPSHGRRTKLEELEDYDIEENA